MYLYLHLLVYDLRSTRFLMESALRYDACACRSDHKRPQHNSSWRTSASLSQMSHADLGAVELIFLDFATKFSRVRKVIKTCSQVVQRQNVWSAGLNESGFGDNSHCAYQGLIDKSRPTTHRSVLASWGQRNTCSLSVVILLFWSCGTNSKNYFVEKPMR